MPLHIDPRHTNRTITMKGTGSLNKSGLTTARSRLKKVYRSIRGVDAFTKRPNLSEDKHCGNTLLICNVNPVGVKDIISQLDCSLVTLAIRDGESIKWPNYPKIEMSLDSLERQIILKSLSLTQ